MAKVKDYYTHDSAMEEIFSEQESVVLDMQREIKELEFQLEQKDKYIEHLEKLLKANTIPL